MGTVYVIHNDRNDFGEQTLTAVARIVIAPGDARPLERAWYNTNNADGIWSLQMGAVACPDLDVLAPIKQYGANVRGLRSSMVGDVVVDEQGVPQLIAPAGFAPITPELAARYRIDQVALQELIERFPSLQPPALNLMVNMASEIGSALAQRTHQPETFLSRHMQQAIREDVGAKLADAVGAVLPSAPGAELFKSVLDMAATIFEGDLNNGMPTHVGHDSLDGAHHRLQQLAQGLPDIEATRLVQGVEAVLAESGWVPPQPVRDIDFGW